MARVLKAATASAVGEYSGLGDVRGEGGVRDGTPGPEAAAPWPALLGLLRSALEVRSFAAVSTFRQREPAFQGRLG